MMGSCRRHDQDRSANGLWGCGAVNCDGERREYQKGTDICQSRYACRQEPVTSSHSHEAPPGWQCCRSLTAGQRLPRRDGQSPCCAVTHGDIPTLRPALSPVGVMSQGASGRGYYRDRDRAMPCFSPQPGAGRGMVSRETRTCGDPVAALADVSGCSRYAEPGWSAGRNPERPLRIPPGLV